MRSLVIATFTLFAVAAAAQNPAPTTIPVCSRHWASSTNVSSSGTKPPTRTAAPSR